MSATIIEGDNIRLFHLLQLKYALRLEMSGLRHSQGSVYAYVKRVYGLRGNRASVYQQFCAMHGLSPEPWSGKVTTVVPSRSKEV